jgi:hypothetical protein
MPTLGLAACSAYSNTARCTMLLMAVLSELPEIAFRLINRNFCGVHLQPVPE